MSQGNPEAREVEEGAVSGEQMLMTNQQPTKLTKPGVGSLHNPAANISPQLAPVFVTPFLVVLAVGRNQLDAALLQSLAQQVGVVTPVGNYALWLLPRAPRCSGLQNPQDAFEAGPVRGPGAAGCRSAASAREAKVQSTATVRPSTAPAASS